MTESGKQRAISLAPHVTPFSVALFAAAVFSLLPISTDMYLPSLPVLKTDFGITSAMAQLTLSSFVVGFALAQLFYGPLSDRFGRRPVLLAAVAIYMLASVACMLAPSIELLILARVLQGIGACGGQVMSRAIVRDIYEPKTGARVLSWMTQLYMLAPMFAPMLGSYLTALIDWRANFAFLSCYGIAVFGVIWYLLEETNRYRDPGATNSAQLLRNARTIWRNPTFRGYAACFTLTYCGLLTYLSAVSFVLLEVYDVPTEHFGFWFVIGVAGTFFGAWLCAHLSGKLPLARLLTIGVTASATGGLAMLILVLSGIEHPLVVIIPAAIYLFGHGINTPVCMAAAVGPFPKMAGTASSLLGFTQQAVAAVVAQMVLRFYDVSAVPLAIALAIIGCTILVMEFLLVRRLPPEPD